VGAERVEVSSTGIRETLRAGLPLAPETVPELVIRYLAKYPLYR